MPIIERVIMESSEVGEPVEKKEIIVDIPDKSGKYQTAYGELEITLGPVIAKFGQANMRKVILRGDFLGDKRRVMQLHPSPHQRTLLPLSEVEFLCLRSRSIKGKKVKI